MSLEALGSEVLDAIRAQGTYRSLRRVRGAAGPELEVDGQRVTLFAGSNYLDLAHHPEVVEAAARAARDWGCASGGSRLINGNLEIHEALEAELARFLGTESALVFGAGYMANLGILPALVGEGDAIISDSLSHASIIDGCKLSRANVRIFPHSDIQALEHLLEQERHRYRRALLIVDGVYSMDGDVAPLAELRHLARRYELMLMVDDTHGTGTLGASGRGSVEEAGLGIGDVDLLLGSLAKALGSYGAFAAGTRLLRDLLVNTCRSFIFSCALPPPQVEAARAALRVLQAEPWRREKLRTNAERLRNQLAARGIDTAPSVTQIIPVGIGANDETMRVCARLLARGFFAQGIRHPSVPTGTARLRLTTMATHDEAQIDALAEAVAEELERLPGKRVREEGA